MMQLPAFNLYFGLAAIVFDARLNYVNAAMINKLIISRELTPHRRPILL